MKKTLTFVLAGALAGILFSGCCNCKKTKSHYQFEETVWKMTQFEGKKVKQDDGYTIAFMNDGRINGKGACNTFFGPWNHSNRENGIKIGHVASTLMACLNDNGMESRYFQALEKAVKYRVEGDRMYLYDQNDQIIGVFEATNKKVK